jgi:GT2 family glycosyltransferase
MADAAARAACVVVTYNALPWIEQCLESVAEVDTVVVDNGSGDGTVDLVREGFPAVRVVESENRGLSAGWNTGIEATDAEHVLLLNADAWLVEDALPALVVAADRYPRAAVIGPRLLNTDTTLQRSVRGYPTLWRLATEYLYLRKLAPRSRALNAFYGAGFDHESEREVEWVMGACLLVRRAAYDEVGPFDERYFMFSEEVDWMRRAADRGWSVVFTPERCHTWL